MTLLSWASAKGGLTRLTEALADAIGRDRFMLGARSVEIRPQADGRWQLTCQQPDGLHTVTARQVVTTTGAYALPSLLPFIAAEDMEKISSLYYAPVMQVSVGVKRADVADYRAFGGLVPSCEGRDVLGMLYPSACFDGRSPREGMLFAFFMGGVRHPEMLEKTDEEIKAMVCRDFHEMLKFPADRQPDLIEIFRHQRAIPQYRADSGERIATVEKLEKLYPGLVIAGNLKDGIGMADRIRQATAIGTVL